MYKAASDPQKLEQLIKNGKDVNEVNKAKGTPIFGAIEAGSMECVELLINNGAKLNARRKQEKSCTPLIFAAKCGEEEIFEKLLNIEGLIHNDEDGLNVSFWCVKLEEENLLRAVLKCVERKGPETMKKFVTQKTVNKEELPLLHFAIGNNVSQEIISLLLKHGFDLEGTDQAGRTPLLYGAMKSEDMIPFLLEKGAKLEAVDAKKNNILHLAAMYNECIPQIDKAIARKLVNEFNEDGYTVAHVMAAEGWRDLLKDLEKYGYDKDLKTKDGKSLEDLLEQFEKEEKKEIEEEVQQLVQKEQEKEREKEQQREKEEQVKKAILSKQKRKFRQFYVKNDKGEDVEQEEEIIEGEQEERREGQEYQPNNNNNNNNNIQPTQSSRSVKAEMVYFVIAFVIVMIGVFFVFK